MMHATSLPCLQLIEQAKQLEAAGVFSMVLECVPEEVADEVTRAVSVPTIGIGAGPHTSGYAECVRVRSYERRLHSVPGGGQGGESGTLACSLRKDLTSRVSEHG